MTKHSDTDDPQADRFQSTQSGDLMVVLHLGFWIALFVGFWFQWKAAMTVSFMLAVFNLSAFLLPVLATFLGLLIALPFEPRTAAGVHLRLFLLMALIAQVWQGLFFLQGVAAH